MFRWLCSWRIKGDHQTWQNVSLAFDHEHASEFVSSILDDLGDPIPSNPPCPALPATLASKAEGRRKGKKPLCKIDFLVFQDARMHTRAHTQRWTTATAGARGPPGPEQIRVRNRCWIHFGTGSLTGDTSLPQGRGPTAPPPPPPPPPHGAHAEVPAASTTLLTPFWARARSRRALSASSAALNRACRACRRRAEV